MIDRRDLVDLVELGRRGQGFLRLVLGILDDQLDHLAVDAAGRVDLVCGEFDAAGHLDAGIDVLAGEVGDDADRDVFGQSRAEPGDGDRYGTDRREQ